MNFLLKCGIAQSVAKGILHIIFIFQQSFFRRCLVEFIAHINAFYIVYKGKISHGGRVRRHSLVVQILHIIVRMISNIVVIGCRRQISDIGIYRLSGWIYGSVDDLAQSREAGGSRTRRQDHRADLFIFIHPAQLHRVIRVHHYNHIFKFGADLFHQIFLCPGKLQIGFPFFEIIIGAVIGISTSCKIKVIRRAGHHICQIICTVDHPVHVCRQVRIFPAGAADHDDCRVGEILCLAHDGVCVGIYGRLRKSPVLKVHTHLRTFCPVLRIQVGQSLVRLVTCVLQRLQDSHR